MPRYVFNDEKPLTLKNAKNADPQVIGEALTKISAATNGKLTPSAVVEAARNRRHPLHRFFEWDDTAAAEKWRQDQARGLIRCVRIDAGDEPPAPAFLSIADRSGTAYRPLAEVLSSVELQLAVLSQAERDLAAFEKRYRDFSDICDLVRAAREKARDRRSNLENRAS